VHGANQRGSKRDNVHDLACKELVSDAIDGLIDLMPSMPVHEYRALKLREPTEQWPACNFLRLATKTTGKNEEMTMISSHEVWFATTHKARHDDGEPFTAIFNPSNPRMMR